MLSFLSSTAIGRKQGMEETQLLIGETSRVETQDTPAFRQG